ncbi:hypothetical protein [Fimbriiglobus ruber]|uniref:Phage protein n=1 Tax=Fimbriiglobus ruber TaxID=1908690 RepID=A0A225DY96_9BACT|nr:hypothetical protein [Fimbriiglobus ruber]OWK44544.1 hypothetical protein FRUB_02476 [Fimbriiglobus ruber]
MKEPERGVNIRIAGNTENPSLLVLRAKGYNLTLWFSKSASGEYHQNFDAEKDGCHFSATTAVELLGLVAMWEVRSDEWQTRPPEPYVCDILYENSLTYDPEGNVIEDD